VESEFDRCRYRVAEFGDARGYLAVDVVESRFPHLFQQGELGGDVPLDGKLVMRYRGADARELAEQGGLVRGLYPR
jgi:hypothetical protein